MYQSFVGLEIHIHLAANTKVFCRCKAEFGSEPNTNICPVCMGYPGVLPVLNEEAIRLAYIVAKAMNCELSPKTYFERKNYFYSDMPKNYQISQFEHPVGKNGYVDIPLPSGVKRVRIHDVHLEEDAGKMIHAGDMSLLDYNRAGYPLLEIVTEPDLVTGEDAEVFLQNFQRLIRYLGVSDGNMEEGSMRCDANSSINTPGAGLGRKVEIKNLNSPRFVKKSLNYEIKRQAEVIDAGNIVIQETRLWNENRDVTESMRTKESSNDYRYFPEPDFPPFIPTEAFLRGTEAAQVELPLARKARLLLEYGITEEQADFIYDTKEVADYYEKVVALGVSGTTAAAWLSGDVQKKLNKSNQKLLSSPLTEERLAELLKFLDSGRIHGKIAKQVLDVIFEENKDPEAIIQEKNWEQLTSASQVQPFIDQVFAAHPNVVAAVKAGEEKQKGFLVGQIMAATGGRAQPQMLNELLAASLK
ncbi:MAG: glutaminyl-tRNA synthase (glutamine-hydrolyzing) subunit B [Spirochaetes bacterium GWB1_48_6]|nr:MAG: glutaminyl-tRNA synthase (glutamine-hydrolyzing) subunit B [Spirochaetes bacterium GWB1_48_6]